MQILFSDFRSKCWFPRVDEHRNFLKHPDLRSPCFFAHPLNLLKNQPSHWAVLIGSVEADFCEDFSDPTASQLLPR